MNPKNTIKKLTTHFKLISILKINKFPKSSYHYWSKKMGHEDPDQELRNPSLNIFKETDEIHGYR